MTRETVIVEKSNGDKLIEVREYRHGEWITVSSFKIEKGADDAYQHYDYDRETVIRRDDGDWGSR